MKNTFLSRYVFKCAYDDNQTILFNSLNGATVLIENEKFFNNFEKLDIESKEQLNKMDFFLDNSIANKQIREVYDNFKSETLSIIFELTQNCNLNCVYCYQKNWDKKDEISVDTIEKTVTYIRNCFIAEKYKYLEVSFFGGEPLVAQNKILLIYEKLKELCKEFNVILKAGVDTNGVLLNKELLEKFDSLNLVISLTLPEDHNKKRVYKNNKGTYDTIINNLIQCKELFNSDEKYKLSIRYNTDYKNKEYFSEFLDILISTGIKFTIRTAYTFEHDYNEFKNTLPLDQYKIWNSSEVIDIMVDKGLQVRHAPKLIRTPCRAYHKHNLKIFSDGYLSLCNGYFPSRKKYKIDDVYNNIDRVKEIFPEKNQRPFDDINCNSCKEVAVCGGKFFCREKPCEYGFVNLEVYLKTYIKHVLNGNAKYFQVFNDYGKLSI